MRLYKKPNDESLDNTDLNLSEGYRFCFQVLFVVVGVWRQARGAVLDFVPYLSKGLFLLTLSENKLQGLYLWRIKL